MKNFAWINTETNLVENTICYDGITPLELPEGIILIEIPEEGVSGEWSMLTAGWLYVDNQFVEPPEPEIVIAPNQPTTTGSQTL